jgi:hypothetical protein
MNNKCYLQAWWQYETLRLYVTNLMLWKSLLVEIIYLLTALLFLNNLERKEWHKIRLERGSVSYSNARKNVLDPAPTSVLLRKNSWNGVLSQKYPCLLISSSCSSYHAQTVAFKRTASLVCLNITLLTWKYSSLLFTRYDQSLSFQGNVSLTVNQALITYFSLLKRDMWENILQNNTG